jgi:hypothetical protein
MLAQAAYGPRRRAGDDRVEVVLQVMANDADERGCIRLPDFDVGLEPARTQQRLVDDVGIVGCADNDHAGGPYRSIE